MKKVTILILLESFLQYVTQRESLNIDKCRNPYFIGILSAIGKQRALRVRMGKSQSLFYWNPFCNICT